MSVAPVPEGYTTVTPWMITRDTARLIDYVTAAFDAEEIARIEVGEAIGHAEVRIGDSVVMMFDAPPDWPPTPGFMRLYVDDADATQQQAIAAGGREVTAVTHQLFGDRAGRVSDPLGNLWWIHARVEDVSEDEMARRFEDPLWIERMSYAQNTLYTPPGG